jgi:4-hydroxy-2-oxoheptanedioate aldolase
LQKNVLKAKLKQGEAVFGCFFRYADPSLVDFLGFQGWDFFVFDGEHGTLQPRECENLVRAAELRGVTPLIRMTTNDPPTILRYLDTGAQGGHVPWVNSAAEAEKAVQSFKYYPRGLRGLAGVRAAEYGQRDPLGVYIKQANAETLVIIHIETMEAVENISDIIAVDGVDVIFIGPTDLSHSLGVPGQLDDPNVQAAIDHVVDVVKGAAPALGTFVGSAAAARSWVDRGAQYLATGFEALVGPACRAYLRSVNQG